MNWFKDCQGVEDIKTRYKDLAKQHHPDLGGDTRTMQEINAQYQDALKGRHQYQDNEGFTYYYNEEIERDIADKLVELLAMVARHPDLDIKLYLVGKWIWFDGDTKPVKDELKEAGCRWAPKHTRWYWRHELNRSRGNGGEFEDIARKYGLREVRKGNERPAIDRKRPLVVA